MIAQNVDKISMGYYGRAYIDKDGELWVWGYNYDGLLGIGASTSTTIPSPTHVNLVYADGTKVKAKEVLEILAPIAHHLGIHKIKSE